MKDLICIFTYCPDFERKRVLLDLLNQLQSCRNRYDILILSHSSIPEICSDLSDFIFIDSENFLIENFNQRNKFWFQGEKMTLESTLVYPPSTHYAIYSLIHFAINFTKHRNIKKIHCIEYDINLPNLELLDFVSEKLNNFDNVIFRSDEDWCYGTYFAFNNNNFPVEYYTHSKEYILSSISDTHTRMTENYTPKFLGVNDRTTYYERLDVLDPTGVYQKIDNHRNQELNWCIPVSDVNYDCVYFFVFNEKGGDWEVDIFFNNIHKNFPTLGTGSWVLEPICKLSELKTLVVMVNKKLKYQFSLDESNIEDFKNNNSVRIG